MSVATALAWLFRVLCVGGFAIAAALHNWGELSWVVIAFIHNERAELYLRGMR